MIKTSWYNNTASKQNSCFLELIFIPPEPDKRQHNTPNHFWKIINIILVLVSTSLYYNNQLCSSDQDIMIQQHCLEIKFVIFLKWFLSHLSQTKWQHNKSNNFWKIFNIFFVLVSTSLYNNNPLCSSGQDIMIQQRHIMF